MQALRPTNQLHESQGRRRTEECEETDRQHSLLMKLRVAVREVDKKVLKV